MAFISIFFQLNEPWKNSSIGICVRKMLLVLGSRFKAVLLVVLLLFDAA